MHADVRFANRHITIANLLCEYGWRNMFLPPANFEKCNLQNAN